VSVDRSLTRRGFLAAGTAVVSAALLPGGVWSPLDGLEAVAAETGPRLRVGFVPGSAGTSPTALFGAGRARVVDAGIAGRAADRLRGAPARVTFHGFAPTALDSVGTHDVMVDALVPVAGVSGGVVPFFAWTHRGGSAQMTSGRSHLTVAGATRLRFGLRVVAGDVAAASNPPTTVFTSEPDRALPTMQPGVFLLGLGDVDWASAGTLPRANDPAWNRLPALVMSVAPAPA
jgi:hypothetical protein